jgi:DNA modification methylase
MDDFKTLLELVSVFDSDSGPHKKEAFINILEGDCRKELKNIPSNSIHLVLTDPPYFLHGLGDSWDDEKIRRSKSKAGSVGGLPVGMKFDPQQGKDFQKFFEEVSREIIRVLVPGGFFISFSQPRLFHRMAMGAENAGFEIRDMIAWHYTRKAQFKAFSQDHFVEKMDLSPKKKLLIKRELMGRKTAQLRPQFEALMLAQKPKEGTLVDNWLKWRAGLMDATRRLNGCGAPSTVMHVEKPERDRYNGHLTVKPVRLLAHLIELFSVEGQTILDPFLGSGSTALAALQTRRNCVGIEINTQYITIAENRLKEVSPI